MFDSRSDACAFLLHWTHPCHLRRAVHILRHTLTAQCFLGFHMWTMLGGVAVPQSTHRAKVEQRIYCLDKKDH